MKRLFLRIYLATLVALFVGLVIAELTLSWPYDDLHGEQHRNYIALVHPLIVEALVASPPELRRSVLDKWEGISEYQLRLSTDDGVDSAISAAPPLQPKVEFSSNYLTDYVSGSAPVPSIQQTLHYELVDSWEPTYLVAEFVSQLVVIAAIALVTYLVIRPLYTASRALSETAEQFARGNLSERVVVRGEGPFADLSRQFNRMAGEIQQKIAEQKITTDAISHELRTPIMRLRLALDMARASGSEAEIRELLEEMDEDLNDMDGLASQLLTLAKLTYAVESPKFEDLRIRDIIEREIGMISALRPQVDISVCGDRESSCRGHDVLLGLLFKNLLANAQRYARETVRVEIEVDTDSLVVSIDDDGPGIPPEKRDDVFAPFSRLDRSRNRSTGGYGLGLAIVQQSVERHGGRIRIDGSPLGGARFVVRLPREPDRNPRAAPVAEPARAPGVPTPVSV